MSLDVVVDIHTHMDLVFVCFSVVTCPNTLHAHSHSINQYHDSDVICPSTIKSPLLGHMWLTSSIFSYQYIMTGTI